MKTEAKMAAVIRIAVEEHNTTERDRSAVEDREAISHGRLFVAESPDLPGLIVSARDLGTLFDGLPGAIEKHYAARGSRVIVARAHAELPGYAAFVAMPVSLAEGALRRVAELV